MSSETQLNSHDIGFPATSRGDATTVFRIILLCATEVGTQHVADRIERLSLLDGGRHVAIVVLLRGDDCMTAFAKLQMECV